MKNLKELLRMKEPELYDLKLELGNDLFASIVNPVERFLLYKAEGCLGSQYFPEMDMYIREDKRLFDLKSGDCDTLPVVQEIYKKLWNENVLKKTAGNKGIFGDTMTSFQTLLNMYVDKKVETKVQKEYRSKYYKTKNNKVTKRYCLHLYYCMKGFLNKCSDEELIKFANAVHTIGNFIPVPAGFNVSRAHHDCWDLTLCKIREWYFAEKNERKNILIELLCDKKPKVTKACAEWLEECGKGDNEVEWKNFIITNHLEAFVDTTKDEWLPIMFYDNHKWDANMNEDDLLTLLSKNAELILKRGEQMIEKLRDEKM